MLSEVQRVESAFHKWRRSSVEQAEREVKRDVKLYYDPEGDYIEMIFEGREGYFRQTSDDRVMEKVDNEGSVLGFSVLAVSSLKEH